MAEENADEKVYQKIDLWKKKLLDMGMRNRLLNYKDSKRGSLNITAPLCSDLFELFVNKEQPLSFSYIAPGSDEPEQLEIIDDEDGDNKPPKPQYVEIPGDIETDKTVDELQRTLKSLRDKAKTANEEQGVNILYLSFGFLEWKDSEHSNMLLRSPLVLVPAVLTHESLITPYVLSLHEDEIVTNPTLTQKLVSDYGVALPEFDAQADDIQTYIQTVKTFAGKMGWSVTESVSLSLLSFLKINMYYDLDKHARTIAGNPIVRALAGEAAQVSEEAIDMSSYDHDKLEPPTAVFQVLDADSSQLDAISMSKKGASFVLQGPPGTGKSQTIANIIAEAMADGKKVLFVSEKMAALEVVYRRLSNAGLSNFCLILHSHKANKKDVLNSLDATLSQDKISVRRSAMYELEELERHREQLNAYCSQLHSRIEPLGQSIYEANGEIANLKDSPDIIFSIDTEDIRNITREQLNHCVSDVTELSKMLIGLEEKYNENAWKYCTLSNVNHEIRHEISSKISELLANIEDMTEYSQEAEGELGLNLEYSFLTLPDYIAMLDFCGTGKPFPKEWLGDENLEELSAKAAGLKNARERLKKLTLEIQGNYSENVFEINAAETKPRVLDAVQTLQHTLGINYSKQNAVLTDIKIIADSSARTFECTGKILDSSRRSSSVLELAAPKTVGGARDFCALLDVFSTNMKVSPKWFSSDEWTAEIRQAALDEAASTVAEIIEIRKRLLDKYEKEIFDIDYNGLAAKFKTEYTSIFRGFSSSYKQDRDIVRALLKAPEKLSYKDTLNTLEQIKKYYDDLSALKENDLKYRELLGGWYTGENSYFDRIAAAFEAFDRVTASYKGPIPPDVRSMLISGDNTDKFSEDVEIITSALDNENIVLFSKLAGYTDENSATVIETVYRAASAAHSATVLIDQSAKPLIASAKSERTMAEHLQALSDIAEIQEIKRNNDSKKQELKEQYSFLFNEMETDWDSVLDMLSWTQRFKTYAKEYELPVKYQLGIATDEIYAYSSAELAGRMRSFYKQNRENAEWFAGLFSAEAGISEKSIEELQTCASHCRDNLEGLESWIDFCRVRQRCNENGLSEFVSAALSADVAPDDMRSAFLKRFYRLWLDSVCPEKPAVESFRAKKQTDDIDEFCTLDKEQFSIASLRIREKLINGLPNMQSFTSAKDEVGILKRELGKQRKIMPLRKLFAQIPNLLPTLKPCFMMSPLSVSLFLQSESYKFDMVIFDEASQVRTENAIGAISRAKQVIIAGDVNQLPPTNFFSATISDEDYDTEDEEDDGDAFESVLDEAVTVLPELSLKWHYRSKNELLIAFSNSKIYSNSLITFPSPSEQAEDEGVEYVYVQDGIYDRSGKRNNPIEAEKVAEEIFSLIASHPDRSLGVITFSEAQQRAVDAAVTSRRLKNPQFEEFFSEAKPEPFFIKNLENVQGDERDTIVFSIGYGKANPLEKLRMNFGPLNQNGGYRRLNVAVTRAKYNIKLIGSILPTDMEITDTTPRGVKLLRDYIDFAQNGMNAITNEITYTDAVRTESPFEDAVYDYLQSRGYSLATQVGCSGYRIDMAVRHPDLNGRFVLGIECDGASYHSSRTARERDRLRQSVLESMGWKFYRIWSTDWIKDPITEGNRVSEAIDEALAEYRDPHGLSTRRFTEEVNTNRGADRDFAEIIEADDEPGGDNMGFEKYQEISVQTCVYAAPIPRIAATINEIVVKQYPVHIQQVYRQVAPMYSNQKATNKVRDGVDFIVSHYDRQYGWEKRGDFLWPRDVYTAVPKVPDNDGSPRPLEYVSAEELCEAMKVIVSMTFGIEKERLFQVTTHEYGFQKTTANMTEYLEKAYGMLEKSGLLEVCEGKLSITK